jgi:large subunit ribosomal protein L24
MAKSKIQTGDTVKIISGNYKKTVGQVLAIIKKNNGKVTKTRASISTVPGIAKYRRSFKYNGQEYPGMMYQVPRLIDTSNLSHITADNKLSKVKIQSKEGKKVRVLKKNDSEIISVKVVKQKQNNSELETSTNN